MRWTSGAGTGRSSFGLALVYRPLPSIYSLLLVAAEGKECILDTIPWFGNVPGKWLHVRLLMSEVAFGASSCFLVKNFHLISPTSTTVIPGSYNLQTNSVSMARSVSTLSSSEVPMLILVLPPRNTNSALANRLASPCQQIGQLRRLQREHKSFLSLQPLQHQVNPPLPPVGLLSSCSQVQWRSKC